MFPNGSVYKWSTISEFKCKNSKIENSKIKRPFFVESVLPGLVRIICVQYCRNDW